MILGNTEDIFGGIVITNFTIGEFDAEILQKCGMPSGKRRVLDSVICPSIFENAVELLRRKNDKCRIIRNPALKGLNHRCIDTNLRARSVRGGWLTQDNYTFVPNFQDTRFQKHGPMITDPDLRADMLLAWAIGSTSTSNTVTIVKDKMLIGNGAGQTSRKTAAWLAVQLAKRAGHDTTGAAAYSDSFFPFVDAPLELINAGVTAIFTSSGSIGDRDVIALCDENNVSLYMIPDKIGRGFYGG
jgi:phosphoribosylaminoimidazolecarboxamide formyltransferase/IMP cyclohydrolase